RRREGHRDARQRGSGLIRNLAEDLARLLSLGAGQSAHGKKRREGQNDCSNSHPLPPEKTTCTMVENRVPDVHGAHMRTLFDPGLLSSIAAERMVETVSDCEKSQHSGLNPTDWIPPCARGSPKCADPKG